MTVALVALGGHLEGGVRVPLFIYPSSVFLFCPKPGVCTAAVSIYPSSAPSFVCNLIRANAVAAPNRNRTAIFLLNSLFLTFLFVPFHKTATTVSRTGGAGTVCDIFQNVNSCPPTGTLPPFGVFSQLQKLIKTT